MAQKRLTKSRDNKVFFGVLGGIGEYFHIDPDPLRIGVVLLSFSTSIPVFVIYIIVATILPSPSDTDIYRQNMTKQSKGEDSENSFDKSLFNDRMDGDSDDWSDF